VNSRTDRGDIPTSSTSRRVAVVGVTHSSRRSPRGRVAGEVWNAMEDYARCLQERTSLRVSRLPLIDCTEPAVVDRICSLGNDIGIVLVVGMSPQNCAALVRRVADRGGPVVVTEIDLTTIALAASVMSALARQGVIGRRGRVVIAHPERAPSLGPLLAECGVGSITSWNQHDAQDFSLQRLIAHNDLLVDLSSLALVDGESERTVGIGSDPVVDASLALPGLLESLSRHAKHRFGVPIMASSVQALVLLTPAGRLLPDSAESLLTAAVSRYVDRALDSHTPSFAG